MILAGGESYTLTWTSIICALREICARLLQSSHFRVLIRTFRRQVIPVLKEVLRDDGVAGLWRGTAPTLARFVKEVVSPCYTNSRVTAGMSLESHCTSTL